MVGGVGNVSSIDMSTIIIIITNGYIVMSWQLFIDGCMCCYVGRKVYNSRVPIYGCIYLFSTSYSFHSYSAIRRALCFWILFKSRKPYLTTF